MLVHGIGPIGTWICSSVSPSTGSSCLISFVSLVILVIHLCLASLTCFGFLWYDQVTFWTAQNVGSSSSVSNVGLHRALEFFLEAPSELSCWCSHWFLLDRMDRSSGSLGNSSFNSGIHKLRVLDLSASYHSLRVTGFSTRRQEAIRSSSSSEVLIQKQHRCICLISLITIWRSEFLVFG